MYIDRYVHIQIEIHMYMYIATPRVRAQARTRVNPIRTVTDLGLTLSHILVIRMPGYRVNPTLVMHLHASAGWRQYSSHAVLTCSFDDVFSYSIAVRCEYVMLQIVAASTSPQTPDTRPVRQLSSYRLDDNWHSGRFPSTRFFPIPGRHLLVCPWVDTHIHLAAAMNQQDLVFYGASVPQKDNLY